MAIPTGNGTETLQSALWEDCANTERQLIVGVQHHIYTVLSVIIHTQTWQAAGNYFQLRIIGYDSKHASSDSSQSIIIAHEEMNQGQTYVWNDKFSFNGF